MPTKRTGEHYLGVELRAPLTADGQVAAYVWPVRIVRIAGVPRGGPTLGIEVGNQEVARFDCHGAQGHWHAGRYDSMAPNASQRAFPEGLSDVGEQVAWALERIRGDAAALVGDADYGDEAGGVQETLAAQAAETLLAHLGAEGDLRAEAIADGRIVE